MNLALRSALRGTVRRWMHYSQGASGNPKGDQTMPFISTPEIILLFQGYGVSIFKQTRCIQLELPLPQVLSYGLLATEFPKRWKGKRSRHLLIGHG
jgi:hypothetical protein